MNIVKSQRKQFDDCYNNMIAENGHAQYFKENRSCIKLTQWFTWTPHCQNVSNSNNPVGGEYVIIDIYKVSTKEVISICICLEIFEV